MLASPLLVVPALCRIRLLCRHHCSGIAPCSVIPSHSVTVIPSLSSYPCSVSVTPTLSSSPYSSSTCFVIVISPLSSSLLLYHRHPIHRPPCSLVITVLSSSPCSAVSPLHTLCPLIVATALPSPAALLRHSDLSSLLLCHRPPALSPPPCSVIVVCSVIITPD